MIQFDEVDMNKTLSNQKRKLTTIRNQILKARDFDLEKAQLFTTKAILEALKAGKKSLEISAEIGRASVGKECRSRWSPYH